MVQLDDYSEKARAPHSSALAWKIPWAEEPGRLQSMGSLRVGHDWATSLSLFPFMHWRRKWQPTRVLAWIIPGRAEPGGLPSMGSHRVGHNGSDLAVAAADDWLAELYPILCSDWLSLSLYFALISWVLACTFLWLSELWHTFCPDWLTPILYFSLVC